jgi:hypothetical protein
LKTLSFIDGESIGGFAVCSSSGYMALAVLNGADLKAVNFVAPWLHNEEIVKSVYGGDEGVADKIKKSDEAKIAFDKTGNVEYVQEPYTSNASAEAAKWFHKQL